MSRIEKRLKNRNMNGIIRRFFAFLLSACMIFSVCVCFAGCHSSSVMPEFVIPEEFDMSKDYEITFWAKNDTNKNQTAIYQKAISDFHELYPNITVNLRLYTDYSRIYNDVITNISTNTTPNVCITYPDHIATYLTGANTVVRLDALMKDEKYGLGGSEVRFDPVGYDGIISKFADECLFSGHYYALPFMRSTEVCYINKTYVEKLGYTLPDVLTWDFVWEVAEAATAKNPDGTYKINGQKVMIPFIYKSTDNMMIQMLRQKDAGYSDENGNILIFNDTVRGLLGTVAEHAGTGAFSTFQISSYPANFLNAGQCIFAVDSTAGSTWMGTYAPLSDISEENLVEFETAVMTVPQFDTENPQTISQGPSVCIFNKKDPKETLASWLFAQYLLTDGVQIAYAETEGYIPVTEGARNSAEYTDYLSKIGDGTADHYEVKIKATELLLQNIDNTFITPVFNGSASLRSAAGQMIENVTKSVRRGETVDDEYIDKLFDDVTSLYRLNSIGAKNSIKGYKQELGALPQTSVILLCSLLCAWVIIFAWFTVGVFKRKNRTKSK